MTASARLIPTVAETANTAPAHPTIEHRLAQARHAQLMTARSGRL
ncbi:MAG: hypothetical protein AAGF84_04020 [Planctomycetota bacterium]